MSATEPTGLAFVVPSARREGGGDMWLDQLLGHLGPVEAPLVVFEHDGELADAAIGHDCTVEVLPRLTGAPDGLPLRLAPILARVLRRFRPSVTLFWSARAQAYGSRAHDLAGGLGRTAWVQHVMPSTFWVHRQAAELPTDAVVCVSTAVARQQSRLYPRWPTRVVHPGVDLSAQTQTRRAVRAALGVDESTLLVGVIGRVEPWKGQDLAVRMTALLWQRGLPVRLLLVGQAVSPTWPQFAGEVRGLVAQLELTDQVTFTGHLKNIPLTLPALDVAVCASREEGFGLALIEAMACGVPVVATRCGGPEDIIDNGVSGILVAADDPAELAQAVELLLRTPQVAERLAAQGRRVWSARFTAGRSAHTLRQVVAELASGGQLSSGPNEVLAEDEEV
jgi:glycosyltransferase involved in cell wall biosynthesis